MPSATATLSLNLTAIQDLCRVPALRSGTIAPVASVGYAGDFYFDTSTEYPIFDVYGPKATNTSSWPALSSGIRIPPVSLVASISSSLNAAITALQATAGTLSATSLVITNTGSETALTVSQNGPSSAYNIAEFYHLGLPILTVTNDYVGVNQGTPVRSLDVIGDGSFVGSITATNNIYTNNLYTANTLSTSGGVGLNINGFTISTAGVGASNYYSTITTNIDVTTTILSSISSFTAIFEPAVPAAPVVVSSTLFKVVSSVLNGDNFFTVDPRVASRTVSVNGTLSASTLQYTLSVLDINGVQILTTRQVSPTKLTASSASSAQLVAQFNSLLDALTAHGLIR